MIRFLRLGKLRGTVWIIINAIRVNNRTYLYVQRENGNQVIKSLPAAWVESGIFEYLEEEKDDF